MTVSQSKVLLAQCMLAEELIRWNVTLSLDFPSEYDRSVGRVVLRFAGGKRAGLLPITEDTLEGAYDNANLRKFIVEKVLTDLEIIQVGHIVTAGENNYS